MASFCGPCPIPAPTVPGSDLEHECRDEPRAPLRRRIFSKLQHDNRSLTRVAGYREDAYTVAVTGREPDPDLRGTRNRRSTSTFSARGGGARPAFGRAAERERRNHWCAQRRDWGQHFAADPTVVNTQVTVNGVPHHCRWRAYLCPAGRRLPGRGSGLGALEQALCRCAAHRCRTATCSQAGACITSEAVEPAASRGHVKQAQQDTRGDRGAGRRAASPRATAVARIAVRRLRENWSGTFALRCCCCLELSLSCC